MYLLYVNFDIEYNNLEQALIHETWFNLESFQSEIKKYTHQSKFDRNDTKITQQVIFKSYEDANLFLEWLQEDEQKEFVIELVSGIKNQSHAMLTEQNLFINFTNKKVSISTTNKNKMHIFNNYINKMYKKVTDSVFENIVGKSMLEYKLKKKNKYYHFKYHL